MKIEGYKCPNCAGTVSFDSGVQKMKCPFCDSEFEIAALEELRREIENYGQSDFDWNVEEKGAEEWGESEADCLSAGSCPACGAELYGDQNTVATVCPCCGNAQIVAKRLSGMLKPDYVIPFKLKKESAVDALKNFCKGKRLLPDNYLEEKRVNNMQGMYVPFWLFDTTAHGHIRYKATKTKVWSDRDYIYTKTDHYSVVRDGHLAFEKIPVDASVKMDDKYMDSVEPFDYSQSVGFHQSYLAGYLAEKYDADSQVCKARAERRIKTTVETEFRKSVKGYVTVNTETSSVKAGDTKVSYSLFPVWVFNTKFKEENYQFVMNGQTGKLVGRLPVDSAKKWKYGALFTGIIGIILTVLALLIVQPDIVGEFLGSDTNVHQIETGGGSAAVTTGGPLLQMQLIAIGIAWIIAAIFAVMIINHWKSQMDTAKLQVCATAYAVPSSLDYKLRTDNFLYSRTTRIPRPKASTSSKR